MGQKLSGAGPTNAEPRGAFPKPAALHRRLSPRLRKCVGFCRAVHICLSCCSCCCCCCCSLCEQCQGVERQAPRGEAVEGVACPRRGSDVIVLLVFAVLAAAAPVGREGNPSIYWSPPSRHAVDIMHHLDAAVWHVCELNLFAAQSSASGEGDLREWSPPRLTAEVCRRSGLRTEGHELVNDPGWFHRPLWRLPAYAIRCQWSRGVAHLGVHKHPRAQVRRVGQLTNCLDATHPHHFRPRQRISDAACPVPNTRSTATASA